MVLYIDKEREIIAWNDTVREEDFKETDGTIWYGGHFDFENIPTMEGKKIRLRYTEGGEVEISYEEPEKVQLTQNDRIEAGVEYLLATREA